METITDSEFANLFAEQYRELSEGEKNAFDRFKVHFWDKTVFVVAQKDDGVLYFDDVEYGFNISTVDLIGNILTPGGSQYTLKEGVNRWFPI